LPWLQRIRAGSITGVVSAHSLAEIYAVLTRLPVQPRITPQLALQVIQHNIIGVCTIMALSSDDYVQIVSDLANSGLAGGVTYDAIAAYIAKQAQVDHLVTLNAKDFRRIYPELRDKIIEP
jgi:predicted nucleic acid-binding protein